MMISVMIRMMMIMMMMMSLRSITHRMWCQTIFITNQTRLGTSCLTDCEGNRRVNTIAYNVIIMRVVMIMMRVVMIMMEVVMIMMRVVMIMMRVVMIMMRVVMIITCDMLSMVVVVVVVVVRLGLIVSTFILHDIVQRSITIDLIC